MFPEQKHSYARDLRRALLEAGITRAELHADGDRTRQTDFYSFRRAFVTAVGRSGVNMQTAMLAAGHRSPVTHQRYNVPDILSIPTSVLPALALLTDAAPVAPATPHDAPGDEFDVALAQFGTTAAAEE